MHRIENKTLSVLAVAASSLLTLTPVAAQEEVGIAVGSVAPEVEIDDLEGGSVNLADYLGSKPVLIEFWATWCEQCEALAPTIDRAVKDYGDQVAFFAVAVGVGQSMRAVRRHVERHSPEYQFLFDSNGGAVRAFKAPTTAYVVIVDADGVVAYTGVGGNQDIATALRNLTAGEPNGR